MLSAVVQVPGVLVDYAKVSVANARENGTPTKSDRVGDWSTSPLVLNSRAAMDHRPEREVAPGYCGAAPVGSR